MGSEELRSVTSAWQQPFAAAFEFDSARVRTTHLIRTTSDGTLVFNRRDLRLGVYAKLLKLIRLGGGRGMHGANCYHGYNGFERSHGFEVRSIN